MKDLMAIINLNEIEDKIKDLTQNRPIAGLPFAGRYRVIDFTLTNMVNSGISLISIFTKDKYRSLVDHIGSGKPWDLDRKRDGLRMFHPMVDYSNLIGRFGDLENYKTNLDFIKNSPHQYVLLTRSYIIADIDFKAVYKYHRESGTDITMISKHIKHGKESSAYFGMDTLNIENGLVKSVGKNLGSQEEYDMSLEMYILKKDILIDIINSALEKGDAEHLKQAFYKRMSNYKISNYSYDGYTAIVNSTINYYRTQMELLSKDNFNELFGKTILTKTKDEPPTLYKQSSKVTNSIVANGCIIEGTVENSIIFRGVRINEGVVVRNSIIMQSTEIGENANLNFVITDKNVKINKNKILMGDGGVPFVIKKNQIV